jgi:hypothetical protein
VIRAVVFEMSMNSSWLLLTEAYLVNLRRRKSAR